MRLPLRWRDEEEEPLGEADVYAHSYGEHVSDHVDPVPYGPARPAPEIPWDGNSLHHVTSEGLKRQFEERLQARGRRGAGGR
jgi:hypothetical protein